MWTKTMLFWGLMLASACVWAKMHNMGHGSRGNTVIAFAPLAGIAVLFAFVIGIEIGMKSKVPRIR
jgi:hypothetical protein